MKLATLLFVLSTLAATAGAGDPPPNILMIIADDLGIDRVAVYGAHPDPGNTPVIDQLAADGVRFANAWANPFCSSTRATMLTGRYSMRTGIGTFLTLTGNTQLKLSETTIPEALPAAYRNAAVGKWHLLGNPSQGLDHPLLSGFEHHHGAIHNLPNTDGPSAYFDWDKSIDGTIVRSTTYATTDAVDEALGFISQWSGAPQPEPWFLWLAFNAPHKPFHEPPAHLHSFTLPPVIDEALYMKAMTEAMDTEIGRLLSSMDPAVLANTYVIFIGDNGTLGTATTPPFVSTHGKGTVFNGGVHVPLIIKGPGVAQGAVAEALVGSTDIFATVLEMAGASSSAEDSISMLPYLSTPALPSMRPWLYAERFTPDETVLYATRRRAIRDAQFKLRRLEANGQLLFQNLFDVVADPNELNNLLWSLPLSPAAQASFDTFNAVLANDINPLEGITWAELGHGLAGSAGIPQLVGSGSLQTGAPTSIDLSSALASTPAFLVTGVSYVLAPAKGGTLVPSPDFLVPLNVGALGQAQLGFNWPAGLPANLSIYLQAWQPDAGAPLGFSASNALAATTPL